MSSNSNLTNMRRLVEQLRLEASVERIKVSFNPLYIFYFVVGLYIHAKACTAFQMYKFETTTLSEFVRGR